MTVHRPATRWRASDEPCLNCGDPTPGRYCPACGQRKTEVLVSVRTMLTDVLEDQLVLNRALPRTIVSLLFRPGHLTNEYIRGRIVRYIAPFRLYLVASVLFFLLFSFFGLAALEQATSGDPAAADSATISASEAAALQEEVLEGIDTVGMPPAAREAIRASLAGVQDAAAAEDGRAVAQPPSDVEAPDVGAPDVGAPDVEPSEADASDVETNAPLPPGTMQPWAANFENNTDIPILREAIDRKVAEVGHLPPRQAFRSVLEDYIEFAPHMIFLLLPLFAFLLKLLYIRRDRYYAEHFVFALHVHAFAFVVFILMFAFPWGWVDGVLLTWMVIYVWLAMWRVYRQGFFRTTVKWWVLGWSYFWVFSFGMVALAFVTLLLT